MQVFTTSQVAKICKVAPRTVSKWFDSGRLQGFRIPGSQDRRIPRSDLIKFLKEYGMPLGELGEENTFNILVVSNDDFLTAFFKKKEESDQLLKVKSSANTFEAGMAIAKLNPRCVVLDFGIGVKEASTLCSQLDERYGSPLIYALIPEGITPENLERSRIHETMQRPFDPELLFMRLEKNRL